MRPGVQQPRFQSPEPGFRAGYACHVRASRTASGCLTSVSADAGPVDGGVMLLAMADRRVGVAEKLSCVFPERRDPAELRARRYVDGQLPAGPARSDAR